MTTSYAVAARADSFAHATLDETFDAECLPDDDWRDDAACRGRTRLFFPRRAERPEARARREAQALKLCQACPVLTPCREFARTQHEYGFWGGESEEDRHLLGYTVSAPIGIRARAAVAE
jgi:WhiB family redox-sensing transcriptional regulator